MVVRSGSSPGLGLVALDDRCQFEAGAQTTGRLDCNRPIKAGPGLARPDARPDPAQCAVTMHAFRFVSMICHSPCITPAAVPGRSIRLLDGAEAPAAQHPCCALRERQQRPVELKGPVGLFH